MSPVELRERAERAMLVIARQRFPRADGLVLDRDQADPLGDTAPAGASELALSPSVGLVV